MQKVEPVAAGDANGINSVLRYVWQGQLPYWMMFEVRATRIEKALKESKRFGTSAGLHGQLITWSSSAGASSTMHVNAMQHKLTLSKEA